MTRKQMDKELVQMAKDEQQSVYKQKDQDTRGRFARARQAKDTIRQAGE